MLGGFYSGYKYDKGTHWTAILKDLIIKDGRNLPWKEAIKLLWKPARKTHDVQRKLKQFSHSKIKIPKDEYIETKVKKRVFKEVKPIEYTITKHKGRKFKTVENENEVIKKNIDGNEWLFYGKFGFNKTFYDDFNYIYTHDRTGDKKYKETQELRQKLISQQVGFDFYPTPKNVVDKIMNYMKKDKQAFGLTGFRNKVHLLEPSAGTGSIIKGFIENFGFVTDSITANDYESDVILKNNLAGVTVKNEDFLELKGNYDLIIMNPPFNTPGRKNAYFDHIIHAITLMNKWGHIIVLCPPFHNNEIINKEST